jgi:glycosyltransferase involved in cell wall biosynthesis
MKALWITIDHGRGGIADYAHDQANAFVKLGLEVHLLCPPEFATNHPGALYKVHPILTDYTQPNGRKGGLARRLSMTAAILGNAAAAHKILKSVPAGHLLSHFFEYLAPLWSWRQVDLASRGWTLHTILHDPVRDYQIGPTFWHRLSVRTAFASLDTVFLHTNEQGDTPAGTKVLRVPYGVHDFPAPQRSSQLVRSELGLSNSACVIVSFGFIRDNKNLDLVIEALAGVPEAHLVVLGSEQGGGGKPVAFYKELSETLGVSDRVHWKIGFHDQQVIADYLAAADLAALTYAGSFKSSSAAMGVALNYELACLLSGGSRSSEELVSRYGIGVWVEPDSASAIRDGIKQWINDPPAADWEAYARENSWESNARIISDRLKELEDGPN